MDELEKRWWLDTYGVSMTTRQVAKEFEMKPTSLRAAVNKEVNVEPWAVEVQKFEKKRGLKFLYPTLKVADLFTRFFNDDLEEKPTSLLVA